MSVLAALACSGTTAIVPADPSDTVGALLAAVHAALDPPHGIEAYEVVYTSTEGVETVLGGAGDTDDPLAEVGIVGAEERVEVRAAPWLVARARLAELGIATAKQATAEVERLMLVLDGEGGAAEGDGGIAAAWDGLELIARAQLLQGWDLAVHLAGRLNDAVVQADTGRVRQLLRAGARADVAAPDSFMAKTALHQAVACGHIDVVRVMVEECGHSGRSDVLGASPLGDAVGLGHVDIVDLLLRHGADPNGGLPRGSSPLHCVAGLARGGSITEATRLALAATLCAHGCDVNATDDTQATALHVAAGAGYTGIAAFLLEKGARADVLDASGMRPMNLAAMRGHTDMVPMLRNAVLAEHGM